MSISSMPEHPRLQKGAHQQAAAGTRLGMGAVFVRLAVYGLLVGGSIIMLFPFIWGLSSSFKNTGEIFNYPPELIPRVFRFDNYTALLAGSDTYGQTSFQLWYLNSAIVTLSRVLLVLFFDSLAGFAFAKYEFPGRETQ